MENKNNFFEQFKDYENKSSQNAQEKPMPFELGKNSLDSAVKCQDIEGAGKIK